ncbi:hypothetical protein [Candidatus Poriferisodalis sp.]|uniref:hypothetical protein n=1 Tax=Candidatus Poriferisodalis sp. TaxID=3101277 RepID=UPI003B51ECD7
MAARILVRAVSSMTAAFSLRSGTFGPPHRCSVVWKLTEADDTLGVPAEEILMEDQKGQSKLRHRLAVLRRAKEVSDNAAATFRYRKIGRPTYYKARNHHT